LEYTSNAEETVHFKWKAITEGVFPDDANEIQASIKHSHIQPRLKKQAAS
jgi:hypothetical protein